MTGAGQVDPTASDALVAALVAREPAAARSPDRIRIVRAPGRVNLIGEHTDYNDGLVLPAAIDRDVRIAFVPTGDRVVRLTSLASGDTADVDLAAIGAARGHWIDYVAGTAWAMGGARLATAGFAGVIASNLPAQAGLSSSAALELVTAWALAGGEPPANDRMAIARIAQRGENEYVGVQCGLMDQFAAAFGIADAALRLDCRSLDWTAVALPVDELVLVICHSGAPRTLAGSAYNDRRAECARAVAAIASIVGPDRPIVSLRDVDRGLLDAIHGELAAADPVAARRAEHVVGENERVAAACVALAAVDLAALGDLFAASHESLRTLFEVSSIPLDTLVEIARATPGVIAARLTGAGFGGCTVNLVRPDAVADLRAAVERDYERRTRLHPRVFVVAAAAGAGLVATTGTGLAA
jgi:galactokinase